jgi:hypothetical protein
MAGGKREPIDILNDERCVRRDGKGRPGNPGALLYVVLGSALMLGPAAHAQGGPARASMEQCVERVLAGLAKAKAPESEVRRAVLTGCDGPLRATLAEAIKTGEARMCASFEACIDIARKQTVDEARDEYRKRVAR